MRHFFLPLAAALAIGSVTAGAQNQLPPRFDISKHFYKIDSRSVFNNNRARTIEANNALLNADKAPRFAAEAAEGYEPSHVFSNREIIGDLDGPDGELWYYDGEISYNTVVHNEYFTELLPYAFKINIYDNDMKLRGTVCDSLELKADEARVRQVDVLPIITTNYFNDTPDMEVAVSVLVNPLPYGIRPYTYVYSLGAERDDAGYDIPIKEIHGMVSDVLNASTSEQENVMMTFLTEGNKSGLSEEDIMDPEHPENYWKYQLGNFLRLEVYSKADSKGDLTKVFDQEIVYYQCQGNQQDDPIAMTLLRDGKPVIAFPRYEKVFFKPFNSMEDDLVAEEDNSLVIELWEQDAPGQQFALKQSTKIPVVKSELGDVIWSYYGIGGFNFINDITYDGDKASFVITRRDYIASSDSERKTYIAHKHDGSLVKVLFENSLGNAFLADLPGLDPQVMFINQKDGDYYYNFINMRTFETELSLNYGLTEDPSDEPDYIMANIDRTATADGYRYVAEMRMPEYDDVNDLTFMRVAWITEKGKLDHIDKVNMGNNINYAALFIGPDALKPDFFHSDANQEYMMLIKRGLGGTATQEQLLIGQVTTPENPLGKDLMLLGPCEYGVLNTITPISGKNNRLSVSYTKIEADGNRAYTIAYYDLPLDKVENGIAETVVPETGITLNGSIASAEGEMEVFNLQGMRVATGRDSIDLSKLGTGVYLVRAGAKAAKVAIR